MISKRNFGCGSTCSRLRCYIAGAGCVEHFINRVAMGRARFLLYTGFFFFGVFLSVTRPIPPLGQIVIGALKSRNL